MIRSLEDAETWYRSVKSLAAMKRMAGLWDREEIAEVWGHDNRLRNVSSAELRDMAATILDDLDHLAVLVLFSVFEATVPARTEADVDREIAELQHPAVLSAVNELKDAIKNGSFRKVTAAYKKMGTDLTEEVNQVRRFRNWVAHGRQGERPNNVVPDQAIDRLNRYLARLLELEVAGTMSQPLDIQQQHTAPRPSSEARWRCSPRRLRAPQPRDYGGIVLSQSVPSQPEIVPLSPQKGQPHSIVPVFGSTHAWISPRHRRRLGRRRHGTLVNWRSFEGERETHPTIAPR